MLTLDFVGKRYGKLPTEVLRNGSSLDIKIANFAMQYENYLSKSANNKEEPGSELTEDDMSKMLELAKAAKNVKKDK